MKTIGERIIYARKNKNWTQPGLADALKVNLKNISRWELNQAAPGIEAAAAIANALDVSLDFLAGIDAGHKTSPLVNLLAKKAARFTKEQTAALKTIIDAF